MNKKDLYSKVKNVISSTFNINEGQITLQTTSDNIEEWDSLGHINLVINLESAFNAKFDITVIPKLTSVKSIITQLKQYDR